MPTEQIVVLLIAERDKLNRAIEVLQGTKGRGRPPKNPLAAAASGASPPPKKQRRTFTATQRKEQAERMKAYWAVKKKATAKPQPKAASRSKKTAKAA
jgi:hypothetical protein